MRLQALLLNQDDPKRCTATKLVKFGLAKKVNRTTQNTILLDPFSNHVLLPKDKKISNSLTVVDCSWNLADDTFSSRTFTGIRRTLPPLLAGNPVNYSKLNKLTSVEALCGALYIMGYSQIAVELLNKFKWGHTFLELNQNILDDYCNMKSENDLASILHEYRLIE